MTLEDELGEDEEWLKMDQPPEWLLPPEKEEYDDWTPPERKPLIPPPPVSHFQCVCNVCELIPILMQFPNRNQS